MIQKKRQVILPGVLERQFKAQVTRLEDQNFITKLLNCEVGAFQHLKKGEIKNINQYLGWLHIHNNYFSELDRITAFVNYIKEKGTRHLLLIGTGAESAIAEMMLDYFGKQSWLKDFIIVDSTAPSEIEAIISRIEFCKSFIIVSSNSGSNLETLALHRFFYKHMKERRPLKLGEHFAAITTAGTELQRIARRNRFRETFLNSNNCNSRFSALSFTGLIPAAFTRAKTNQLLTTVDDYLTEMKANAKAPDALSLGVLIGSAIDNRFSTINLQMPKELYGFHKWLEQLIGESTAGKQVGILPCRRKSGDLLLPGKHIDIKYLSHRGQKNSVGRKHASPNEIPIIDINLSDPYQLAAEIIKWEIGVVVASKTVSINPFNQTNERECDENTARVLRKKTSRRREIIKPPLLNLGDIEITSVSNIPGVRASHILEASSIFKRFISGVSAADYIAILCYTEKNREIEKKLSGLKQELETICQVPVVCKFGPQYLYIIGQLLKSDSPLGHFLILERDYTQDFEVPNAKYGFAKLIKSQAQGDIKIHAKRRRPLININLKNNPVEGLSHLTKLFEQTRAMVEV